MNTTRQRPLVWYVAAGYARAGGIEAYLFNYATRMREEGFETAIVVFDPLPRAAHRFLLGLRERGIPVRSLGAGLGLLALATAAVLWLPWALRGAGQGRRRRFSELQAWVGVRLRVLRLRRWIARERPDLIHVKGRLVEEAWPAFPPERTLFHVATMGQRDPSWTESEVAAFRAFAERAARVLAPGTGVAETFKREFAIARPVDVVFTMVPDEGGRQKEEGRGQKAEGRRQKAEGRREREEGGGSRPASRQASGPLSQSPISNLQSPPPPAQVRFGILCRFSEEKGIRFLLPALRDYAARHGNVSFTFAGEGDLEAWIRECVKREALEGVRIEKVASVPDALRKMDVFVHPSTSEAMPVAIVEALMLGRPCIVTRVGGIPDLVRDGVEGLVIEPSSSAAILGALERFAAMGEAERAGFAARARARYEACCTPERVGAVAAGIYRAVLDGADSSL